MSTPFTIAAVLACLYLPVPFIMLWLHGFHGRFGARGRRWYVLHGLIYCTLVVGTALLGIRWPSSTWHLPLVLRVSGAVLILAGFATLAVSYGEISGWTAMAGPQTTGAAGRALVTGGVYAHVRHPRYTVLIVGSLGNFLLTGSVGLLAAALLTTTLTVLVIRVEERELISYFGDSYRRYRQSVPALFPRPFPRSNVTT